MRCGYYFRVSQIRIYQFPGPLAVCQMSRRAASAQKARYLFAIDCLIDQKLEIVALAIGLKTPSLTGVGKQFQSL